MDDLGEDEWSLILSNLTVTEFLHRIRYVWHKENAESLWKRFYQRHYNDSRRHPNYQKAFQSAYAHGHDLWVQHGNCTPPVEGFKGKCIMHNESSREYFEWAINDISVSQFDEENNFLRDLIFLRMQYPISSLGQFESHHPSLITTDYSWHVVWFQNPTWDTIKFKIWGEVHAQPSEGYLKAGETMKVVFAINPKCWPQHTSTVRVVYQTWPRAPLVATAAKPQRWFEMKVNVPALLWDDFFVATCVKDCPEVQRARDRQIRRRNTLKYTHWIRNLELNEDLEKILQAHWRMACLLKDTSMQDRQLYLCWLEGNDSYGDKVTNNNDKKSIQTPPRTWKRANKRLAHRRLPNDTDSPAVTMGTILTRQPPVMPNGRREIQQPPAPASVGRTLVQLLRTLAEELRWVDRPTETIVEKGWLIRRHWVALTLTWFPLFLSSTMRGLGYWPHEPVDYALENLPFVINERYDFMEHNGIMALTVMMLWASLGRRCERFTCRTLDDVLKEGYSGYFAKFVNARIPLLFHPRLASKSVSALKVQKIPEHRATHSIFGDDRDRHLCIGHTAGWVKICAGVSALLLSFLTPTPLLLVNAWTLLSIGLGLGMSVSLDCPLWSSGWNDISLVTSISLGHLFGYLAGSSGGILFLLEFGVTLLSMILGSSGTVSSAGLESWGYLILLANISFAGYAVGRLTIMNRKRGIVPIAAIVLIGLALLWTPTPSAVSLVIQRHDSGQLYLVQ